MNESTWNHKGIEVSLSGADFTFRHGGKFHRKSSLAAAKKAIDKIQDEKAKEVALNMPMVFWQGSWRAKCEEGIGRATLTGLSNENGEFRVSGLPGYSMKWVMPDSPENERLITELVEAKKRVNELEEEIGKRDISLWFGGNKKMTYADAIALIQKRWDEARKASGMSDEGGAQC